MEMLGRIPKKTQAPLTSVKYEGTDPRLRPGASQAAARLGPSTQAAQYAPARPQAQYQASASAMDVDPPPPEEEEEEVLQDLLQDAESDDEEVPQPKASSSKHAHSHRNGKSAAVGVDPDGVKRDYGKLRLTQKLPDYNVIRMTAEDLHALIHDGYIDLEPEYQRDVVWSEKKQIMLIDSMLNNFYIPAVIFSVRREWSEEKGMEVEKRVCMDGKQRLTSMVGFMDGTIPYVHNNGMKYWYNVPIGENPKRNQPLPERLKREFDQKPISCIQYEQISEDDEREIFRRVQLGVALSAAEKIQGITSPFANFVRQLQRQYVDAEGTLGDAFKWQKKRGVDFACVAQILFCLYNLPNFSWPGITQLEKFLRKKEVPTQSFQLEVLGIFADYLALASDTRYRYGFHGIGEKVSPVEFVMIGLLLGYMKDSPPQDKAQHIKLLRVTTRKQFKDIRANSSVTKSMWKYISSIKVPRPYVPSKAEPSSRKRKASKAEDEYRPHPTRR